MLRHRQSVSCFTIAIFSQLCPRQTLLILICSMLFLCGSVPFRCSAFLACPPPRLAFTSLWPAFPSPCLAFPSHRRATAMCCRSIPSQRRTMPCLFISKLSPCYALFLHSMPLRRWTPPLLINAARTPPLRIIAMLCHRSDILRLAIAGINSALPSQCFTSPRSALAPRCGAMPLPWLGSPLRFNANPSPCTVTLNYSIPLPNIALALPYYAAPRLCDHSIAIPLLCLSTQN